MDIISKIKAAFKKFDVSYVKIISTIEEPYNVKVKISWTDYVNEIIRLNNAIINVGRDLDCVVVPEKDKVEEGEDGHIFIVKNYIFESIIRAEDYMDQTGAQ